MKKIPEIQILPHKVGPISVASLASNVALALTTDYDTEINRSILLKRVQGHFTLINGVDEEVFLIGMARGEASVTAIKNALEIVQLNNDLEQQAVVRDVLMETVRIIVHEQGNPFSGVHIDVSLGGGKGIPFDEDEGLQWFVYNLDNAAASAGSQEIIGWAVYNGIWL